MSNTPRLPAIYTHTVSIFGHALFLSESVFEFNHESVKSSLTNIVWTNYETLAMHKVLSWEWFLKIRKCRPLKNSDQAGLFEFLFPVWNRLHGLCRPKLLWAKVYSVFKENWGQKLIMESIFPSGNIDILQKLYSCSTTVLLEEENGTEKN